MDCVNNFELLSKGKARLNNRAFKFKKSNYYVKSATNIIIFLEE